MTITPYYEGERFTLYNGDCLTLMAQLEANSIDAIVTDPPAGISFMGKDWDHHKGGRDAWVAWLTEVMRECLRVLKPGGHALVWALPRTSHWTGWAIESAGFEVRDRVSHLFGSGFPKSLDISKQIDSAAGAEREIVGVARVGVRSSARSDKSNFMESVAESAKWQPQTVPTTDAAKQWNGWGTALKPACEDWWLCRKSLDSTVAENVLKHGTGGLNIDGCRIETAETLSAGSRRLGDGVKYGLCEPSTEYEQNANGRWPANVIHDGSDEVLAGFPDSENNYRPNRPNHEDHRQSMFGLPIGATTHDDAGSAARFFYCAKASQEDRNEGCEGMPRKYVRRDDGQPTGMVTSPKRKVVPPRENHHPTVKPTELMRYLCRLITPPGGLVLDPFCGSGSTGKAAMIEGFRFIGIEANADYCALAQRRIEAVMIQPGLFTPEQLAEVQQPRTNAQEGLFAIVGE